jgi:hypothetical protein
MRAGYYVGFALALGLTPGARGADIGVDAKKLIIVDKLVAAGKAKTVFVSKDQTSGITKGVGTNVDGISVTFDFAYTGVGGATAGRFEAAQGASNGTDGWLVNKDAVAKYVNKNAPGAPTGAKVAVVKPGKLLKIVGKDLGDVPIDLQTADAPAGDVCAVYTVTNGGETNRHCSVFPNAAVAFQEIAGGTGRKLVAKGGMPDPGCAACGGVAGTTTTTITGPTTTTSTTVPVACDGQGRFTVSFAPPAGGLVAGMTLLVDYPQQLVQIPPAGSGPIAPANFVPAYPPANVFIRGNDVGDDAVRVVVADTEPVPAGPLAQVIGACATGIVLSPGQFGCVVENASDAFSNPVNGVSCSVSVP